METWLDWRKRVGLPPVPQERLNELLTDEDVIVVDEPRKVQALRKVTLLFGLITYYKAI